MDALIGYTGYVGSTLARQRGFDKLYRSTNIDDIRRDGPFDTIVCAGAPGKKWLANKEPENDRASIKSLTSALSGVSCRQFILISTVDVFADSNGADEDTPVQTEGLHPYGANRYLLEEFVQNQFTNHLIIRLPGLVGPGLRKNILFDIVNDNDTGKIDTRSVFQFYPMVNLRYDIDTAVRTGLHLIHLTAEPVSVADVFHSMDSGWKKPTTSRRELHHGMTCAPNMRIGLGEAACISTTCGSPCRLFAPMPRQSLGLYKRCARTWIPGKE